MYSRSIRDNKEVMDVLACLLVGHQTVKEIEKTIKQSKALVSTKLRWLIKNGLVEKAKWNFSPNWKGLYTNVRQIVRDYLKSTYNHPKSEIIFLRPVTNNAFRDEMREVKSLWKNTDKYFSDKLIKAMLKGYARYYFELGPGWAGKKSLKDVVDWFFAGLNELKADTPEILKIKNSLPKFVSTNEEAFVNIVEEEYGKE